MATGTLKTSILQYGSNNHTTTSEEANYFATDFVTPGTTGAPGNTSGFSPATGTFAVNAQSSPNMSVQVTGSGAGAGAYISTTPNTQDQQTLRVQMIGNNDITIAANASGVTKYDWIYIKVDPILANNPDINAITVATFVTSRSTNSSTDNGGLAPTFGQLLAIVAVINGASSITNANIQDKRIQAGLSAPVTVTGVTAGWNPLSALTFIYGANNGNKEFTVTQASDLTGTLSAGMRFSLNRTVTPPSQSMKFIAASSQFASKSSPAGIIFTAAFTVEAWVYLNSYTNGAIISRFDGTNGWQMTVTADGQLNANYFGGGGNTAFASVAGIPLNTWTHVAVAVTSVASKTAICYINGLAVPSRSAATTATTLTQAGSLQVGASNSTLFFDGLISEARVWSVAQSSANIQANMAISLTGSETNLVALFAGNGTFTDATTNLNALTASGGAIATNTGNPYNLTEYAIITKVAFSAGVTTLTLFTGLSYNIPNQTLTGAQYSLVKTPFGFPVGPENWRIIFLEAGNGDGSNSTTYTQANIGAQISVPTGSWRLRPQIAFQSAEIDFWGALSTSTTSVSHPVLSSRFHAGLASAVVLDTIALQDDVSLSAQTVFYIIGRVQGGGAWFLRGRNNDAFAFSSVVAVCGYV